MRHVLFGLVYALISAIAFSMFASVAICLGVYPEARWISDSLAPLLAIFVGTYFASRPTSWRAGAGVGLVFVALWLGFWMYVMGRINPLLWIEEGLPHFTLAHLFWWGVAVLAGVTGGSARRLGLISFLGVVLILCVGAMTLMVLALPRKNAASADLKADAGNQVERQGPMADGTVVYLLTFDFQQQKNLSVGLYDCDADDAKPYDDSNTTYMRQSLGALVDKLAYRAEPHHRDILCVINGGFFGASRFLVAHHEEPMVLSGRALYDVDLLKPKDQGWLFAINSTNSVLGGKPRFTMVPSLSWNVMPGYQDVLGGVRPLRFKGNSILLRPGAGSTSLRCSRTSVGWSADGNKFYVLVVKDPDGEAASQIQRKLNRPQTGGWDVNEVQKFWEQRDVPFALLFDGGESTQLAFRRADGGYDEVLSGYQYSFTLGYLLDRPLMITPPILPPSEAHRGVLNYLYIEGPRSRD